MLLTVVKEILISCLITLRLEYLSICPSVYLSVILFFTFIWSWGMFNPIVTFWTFCLNPNALLWLHYFFILLCETMFRKLLKFSFCICEVNFSGTQLTYRSEWRTHLAAYKSIFIHLGPQAENRYKSWIERVWSVVLIAVTGVPLLASRMRMMIWI